LSKSFDEISSFLNMGLGFLNIGLDIVPRLLDKRMAIMNLLNSRGSLIRGKRHVNSSTLHLSPNFLSICIEVAQASWT